MSENLDLKSYEKFYKYVKRNLIEDHFTAGIKNEVSWDMLLTEFVPYFIKYKEKGKFEDEYKLLMKEFPIIKEPDDFDIENFELDQNSLKCPKVDYLVSQCDNLYFVELKTSSSSVKSEQKKLYKKYLTTSNIGSIKYIVPKIVKKYGASTQCEKGSLKGSQKYSYSAAKFINWLKDRDNITIKVYYLTFFNLGEETDGINYCNICDLVSNKQFEEMLPSELQSIWSCISEIFNEFSEQKKMSVKI